MRLSPLWPAAILTLGLASPLGAQTPPPEPLARFDVTALIGWLAAQKPYEHFTDWDSSLYGGAAAGWYWTDHLKTEVEGGASMQSERRTFETSFVGGHPISRDVVFQYATRRIGLGQQYQFYRNAMFHPYVGAGAELTWETTTRQAGVFSGLPQERSQVRELVTRPYVSTGFKAYISSTAFFRGDVKVAFRSGRGEVLVRFGFGADF